MSVLTDTLDSGLLYQRTSVSELKKHEFFISFVTDKQDVASPCRHCAVLPSLWLGSVPRGAPGSPHSSAGAVRPGLSAPHLLPALLLHRESPSLLSGFCAAAAACINVLVSDFCCAHTCVPCQRTEPDTCSKVKACLHVACLWYSRCWHSPVHLILWSHCDAFSHVMTG